MADQDPDLPPDAVPLKPGSLSGDDTPRTPVQARKPQVPATYARVNSQGLVELIDLVSGRTVAVQKSYRDILENKWDDLVEITTPDGPVWIERGLPIDKIRLKRDFPFSKVMTDLICEKIVTGTPLLRACEELGLRYSTVCKWRRENADFKEALKMARKDRAEAFHDQALERSAVATEENSKADKLRIDTLKWAAEKGDPEEFGNQTKVVGDKNQPVVFTISTGINREKRTDVPVPAARDVSPALESPEPAAAEWEP
jgi:hypothetical protein